MKKIFMLIVTSVILFSCQHKLSERDKDYIKAVIGVHEMTVGLKYRMDSIANKEGRPLPKYYDLHTDPHLTYDKFMDYCNKHNYDPLVEAKLLASQEK